MKKTFISNLILLMSVNLLIKPFWILGIDRGVQNYVGYEQYGIYSGLMAFSLLLITLLDLGINTYVSSNVAKNPDKLKDEFIPLTGFKLASAIIYVAVTLILGKLNGFDSYRIQLLLFLTFNQILSYFYIYFRSIIGGLQLFRIDAVLSVVDRILMIIFCGLMLWTSFLEMSIERFIYAQTIAYSLAISATILVLKGKLIDIKFKFNLPQLTGVLKQMFPYALLSLIMTFYTRMDAVLLPKLLVDGDYQNGVYASAYRLLEASNMMAAMVSMLLLPIFSKMISERENMSSLVQLCTGIMIIPAITLSYSAFLYRNELMYVMFPRSDEFAGEVFGIVILSFIPLASMYVYGTLLTANAEMKILNILALLALVINLLINFTMIPEHKALGAAWATLVTQGFIGISNFLFGKKLLKLEFEKGFALNFLISVLLLLIGGYFIKNILSNWLTGVLAIGLLSISLMILFRIIKLKESLLLLRNQLDKRNNK
jgi:O-antigen/teichoic acid export membrane protein